MTLSPIAPPLAGIVGMFRRRLDKTITIQRPVLSGGVQRYQDWKTVPAAINPTAGTEAATGGVAPTNVAAFEVYIEFIPGLLLSYQVAFEGRFFNIEAVVNLAEQDVFLRLLCNEAQV